MTNILPINSGELQASTAICFFDDIKDETGLRLTKSAKRSELRKRMMQLYASPQKNICTLLDGRVVPIIVYRKNPGRSGACYFNNIDAPQDEILQAFAKITGCTYKNQSVLPKQSNELAVHEAKLFFDDLYDNEKKLTGPAKLKKLHQLFSSLYKSKNKNTCPTPNGNIPIIIVRRGTNNRDTYCLNTSVYRSQIMEAFAKFANCIYRADKENLPVFLPKVSDELTARQCARIFHNVPNLSGTYLSHDASPKIVAWFDFIGKNPKLNKVLLPDNTEVPLVVYRKSHAQVCWCLNSSDEKIKPFVINRFSRISGAEVCLDNIHINSQDYKSLYQTMMLLSQCASKSQNIMEKTYFSSYAQKIYQFCKFSNEITLHDFLLHKNTRK